MKKYVWFSIFLFFACIWIHQLSIPPSSYEPKFQASFQNMSLLPTDRGMSDKQCSPKQTIVLLKTHKTGSTTLSRIIELYGYRHSLSFVRKIREVSSIHYSNRRFNNESARGFLPPPNVTLGDYKNYKFNIMTLHVRYDRAVINRFMKKDPIHLTILREPSKQFESAFSFFGIGNVLAYPSVHRKTTIQEFLSNPKKYPRALFTNYIYNDQMFDLGLEKNTFNNETAVNEAIARLDEEIDLVLINEYYDESLVLLSKVLCWSLDDLLYLPANQRPDTKKTHMSEELAEKARKWNHADTMLYNYFVKRLHQRIYEYGPSFMDDLWRLRNMTKKLREACVRGQLTGTKRLKYRLIKNHSKECEYHTERSLAMDKKIRKLMLTKRTTPLTKRSHHNNDS